MKNLKSYYSIEIRNTQEKLVEIFNNCKLPFSIQQLILNNLSNLVDSYAMNEYQQDLQEYNKQLEEIKKQEEEKHDSNNEEIPSEENN